MQVLFFAKYSRLGGSSKHMTYSYVEFFEQAGMQCTVAPLFDDFYFSFRDLSKPATLGEILKHSGFFSQRILNRFFSITQASQFDIIMLEKELIPYLPFGLEHMLKKLQPKLISQFDDAVHVQYQHHSSPLVRLLCGNKIRRVIETSCHIFAWNKTLAEYARCFNPNVTEVDTAIDLRRYHCKLPDSSSPTGRSIIGWIGTPNSFAYLTHLQPALKALSARYDVELRVISSHEFQCADVTTTNRLWRLDTEVDDLYQCDIGIMPLLDNEWTRGKSAYKLVQYMGVAIPVVASPVGINTQVVQDGINGLLANSPEEWIEKLSLLIENPGLRQQMGLAGRKLVEDKYSIQVVAPRLVHVLKEIGSKEALG